MPRGALFHGYDIENGVVIGANCIIPTGQNIAKLGADMRVLVPTMLDCIHLAPLL